MIKVSHSNARSPTWRASRDGALAADFGIALVAGVVILFSQDYRISIESEKDEEREEPRTFFVPNAPYPGGSEKDFSILLS
jgi:hypothetical protein